MKKIVALYILIQVVLFAGNASAVETLDFICPKYKPATNSNLRYDDKKCFEEVKAQLKTLGCETLDPDLKKFWPQAELGTHGAIDSENCYLAGPSSIAGELQKGTQIDCDNKANSKKLRNKYRFVKNEAKSPMLYGVCVKEIAELGTLDFYCDRFSTNYHQQDCYRAAQGQLRKMGCEIDEIQTRERTHYSCNANKTCGILLLKNCRYAGGSDDGKVYKDGGTQESCNEGGYKLIPNPAPDKEKMFPGICYRPLEHQPSEAVPSRDQYKR